MKIEKIFKETRTKTQEERENSISRSCVIYLRYEPRSNDESEPLLSHQKNRGKYFCVEYEAVQ